MNKFVSLTILTERVKDNGRGILKGTLGMAEVVGFPHGEDDHGNKRWIICLVTPDERALARRRAFRKRQYERDEGVVEVGGWDG